MKTKILTLALTLALILAFVPVYTAAAEKSIMDKINDGDLLHGLTQFDGGIPAYHEGLYFANDFTLEENAALISRLGVKAYKLGIELHEVLSNPDELGRYYTDYKDYIKLVKELGVDEVIGSIRCFFIYHKDGTLGTWADGAPRRDLTEGSEYLVYLDMLYRSCKTVVTAFPEISIWQLGNAPNWLNFPNEEPYTMQEKVEIAVDMMYYATKGVKEANPNAITVMFPLDGSVIGDSFDEDYVGFMTGFYETITSGGSVSGSKSTDDYFQVIAWNAFSPKLPDEGYIRANDAIFEVAKKYGDGHKKVIISDVGFDSNWPHDPPGVTQEELFRALFECIDKMDYVASVSIFTLNDGLDAGGGLFTMRADGFMPKPSAYFIQELYGGKGDLREFSLVQSPTEWPHKIINSEWTRNAPDSLTPMAASKAVAMHAGKAIVICDPHIINGNYSFGIEDAADRWARKHFYKGDPRITVSGNTITLDIRDMVASCAGFTVLDEGVYSGVHGVYLDLAYDGTETEYLPYLRAAVSVGLLAESQTGRFTSQITRDDFDAFMFPLFERKFGYDVDMPKLLGTAHSALTATANITRAQAEALFTSAASALGVSGGGLVTGTGAFTRGDCVKAIARLFEMISGTPSPNMPSGWAENSVSKSMAANLVPWKLQNQYTSDITRAEFCALAAAIYETHTGTVITTLADFADTDDINVRKMAGLNVVNGNDGKFNPDLTFNRESAAALFVNLLRALDINLPKVPATFNDRTGISGWALEQVGQVQAAGLISGSGGNFDPQGKFTRESGILLMLNLWEYLNR